DVAGGPVRFGLSGRHHMATVILNGVSLRRSCAFAKQGVFHGNDQRAVLERRPSCAAGGLPAGGGGGQASYGPGAAWKSRLQPLYRADILSFTEALASNGIAAATPP